MSSPISSKRALAFDSFVDSDSSPVKSASVKTAVKTAKKNLFGADSSPTKDLKGLAPGGLKRALFELDTNNGSPCKKRRVEARPLTAQSFKDKKIQIYQADYEDEKSHSIADIPGLGIYSIRRLDAGTNHLIYVFEPGQAPLQLPGADELDYLHYSVKGTYDLSTVILKTVLPTKDPKSKIEQIKIEKKALAKEGNPEYRTQLYFYSQDGVSLEQRVTPFQKAVFPEPNVFNTAAFEKALAFAKKLLEMNVEAQETVVFDIRPDNIGFTPDQQEPLFLDRDTSPKADFSLQAGKARDSFELVKDIGEWMIYQNTDASVKQSRFEFLTSGFSEELKSKCWEQLKGI